ncbi:hypothetical protein CASFOL_014809 [Castilleja foliolosa]|uniref:Uncharacterized protein n=1 Tax=Castilleja foliolosa TaxID=1961234 RepID=A0ABD3DE05_9LAMI
MMTTSETEEVVGIEAQCGLTHQDLPKLERNGTNSPDDLDGDSYVLDFKDVSVEIGEVTGNDRGKEIHVCVGDEGGDRVEEEAENQIGVWSLVAESADNSVIEECELLVSLDLESKSIDSKEEKCVVECESRDTRTEVMLSEGEVVEIAKPQVPSSTLKSNPINTKEETDVAELEFENVSLKRSSGGAVDTAQQHGVPINTPDVAVGVVERESQGVGVRATEEDEVKLLEGEGIGIAKHEVLSSTFFNLNLEPNPICTKEEVDVVANVTECELQYTSVKAVNEVVENAEHETLNLESNPVDAKLSGEVVKITEHIILDLESNPVNAIDEIDVVADVESESQDPSVTAGEEVKLLDKVVGIPEHEALKLESNPVNSKLSSEKVKNAEHEILDLESNPVKANEKIDVVADVVERESQYPGLKAVDEVKLSDEVVESAEHKTLDLESKPVNANLSGEVVKHAAHEILDFELNPVNCKLLGEIVKNAEREIDLESNPVNGNGDIDVVADFVELESQDPRKKGEDEVSLSDEVVENAEHGTFDLELNIVNAKLSGEVVKNAEHEILDLESNPVNAKLSGEMVKNAEIDLESIPVNSNEEIDVVADVVELESQEPSVKPEDEVKLSDEVVENAEHETLDLESNPVNAKLSGEVVKNAEHEILDLESNPVKAKLSGEMVNNAEREIDLESTPVNSNGEIDVVADVVELESQEPSVKPEDEVKLSDEVVENGEHETLDLESNPVNAKLSGEVLKNAEHEILDLESNPVKAKLSGEMVKNAEREIDLESTPVNSNEEIDVVADIVELESQEPSVKPEDEVKLSDEVVENVEHETLDLESNPVNTKLSGKLVKNAEPEILDLESSPVNANEEIDADADVVELESQDPSVKAEDEVKLLDEAVENAEHETLDLDSNPVNAKLSVAVVKNAEHEIFDLESNLVNAKLFSEVVKIAEREVSDLKLKPVNANEEIYVVADVEPESQDPYMKDENEVKLSDEVVGNAEHETLDLELNPMNDNEVIDVVADVVELESQDPSVKAEDEVKLSGGVENTEHHVTLEPEVHVRNISAISSGEYSPDVNKEGAANNIELVIEAVEDKVVQTDDENLVLRENGDTRNSRDNNTPVAPPKVEEASVKTKIKSFNFLVRVPRFDDESLREQTRLAKINVDEKTKLRGAIQVQIQEKRASAQIHGIDYEYAKGEIRNARKMVRLKRIEIDSLQSVINKAKNALSIGDIDSQIYNNEHMIQHETLPLKEEKQLIREIKQLKQHREQLSSNMGSKDEIKQALEQREEVEERLKILRKELVSLKGEVVKAEAAAVEAEKKYDAENKKVKEIQAQFRAADDVRQAAYVQWQSLRKELSKKSEYFYKYKDDSAVASNCVFSKDTDALYRLCTNNVEKFMELWNTDDKFRRDYVKSNTRSTIWRLGTSDGRSLGPDEVPPVLPSYVDTRVNRNVSTLSKVDLKSQFPTLEPKQENTAQSVTSDGKSTKKLTEEKILRVTNKEPAAIFVQENGSDTVSGQDIIINELHEEPKKSKEEIEAKKKAEERERKETDAKLKEERRLEALAKASEARERKKRQAEKLQMRSEMKTIKEAEQKEKEREKRLRKKERKKATTTDVNDTNCSEIALSSESAAETSKVVEFKDVSSVAAPKKPKKHWLFGKQSKAKSTIPPPLRNRNKKKLQQWMWVGITSFVILVLCLLGNMGVFSGLYFKRRSPAM